MKKSSIYDTSYLSEKKYQLLSCTEIFFTATSAEINKLKS